MGSEQIGLSVAGAVILVGLMLAGALVWLFLTDTVTVANAVSDGEITPFIQELAQVLIRALQGLLKYL